MVLVCLALAGCDELTSELQPKPDRVDPGELVSLTSNVTGDVPANGVSTVRLEARIPTEAAARTIKFTTTLGVFVESGARAVDIRAVTDPTRSDRVVASTLLRSDTAEGVAIVRATVGEVYDTLSVRFVK